MTTECLKISIINKLGGQSFNWTFRYTSLLHLDKPPEKVSTAWNLQKLRASKQAIFKTVQVTEKCNFHRSYVGLNHLITMNLKLSDTTINTFKLISCLSSKLLYSFVIIQQKLLILKRGRNSAVSLGGEGINTFFSLPSYFQNFGFSLVLALHNK